MVHADVVEAQRNRTSPPERLRLVICQWVFVASNRQQPVGSGGVVWHDALSGFDPYQSRRHGLVRQVCRSIVPSATVCCQLHYPPQGRHSGVYASREHHIRKMSRRGNITLVACEQCRARKIRVSPCAVSMVGDVFTHASAMARHQVAAHARRSQRYARTHRIQLFLGLPRSKRRTNSCNRNTTTYGVSTPG